MKVLGKLPAKWLVRFGAIEMSTVIILCYILAVSTGHVKPFLPTISACGEHPPEQYPFRYGILVGGLFLVVEAFVLHTAGRSSSFTFSISVIAGLCLGVVAVVSAIENNIVHSTCAVVFFVLEDIASVLLTLDLWQRLTSCSRVAKLTCCAVACIATIGRVMVITGHCPEVININSASFPVLAIVEWTNTIAIVVFQWSLSADFPSLYLATIDDSETQVKPTLSEKQKLVKQVKDTA